MYVFEHSRVLKIACKIKKEFNVAWYIDFTNLIFQ